jgi:dTMP kinase
MNSTQELTMESKRGIFVVLDGNDGSGKATQSKLLSEFLSRTGTENLRIDFPGYERNFFGKLVGECLAGKHGDFVHIAPKIASSLYALDRLESSIQINEVLSNGGVIVADRFASSNQIHQGGKISNEEERAEFLVWLDRMEHEVLRIPRPDVIIYLKVPLEISLRLLQEKRAKKNGELGVLDRDTVEEDRNYLEQSHRTAGWLSEKQGNWHVIDCASADGTMRSVESIHEEIRALVVSLIA